LIQQPNSETTNWYSRWFIGVIAAFIVLNSWLITHEFFFFPFLPLAFLILFSALISLDKLVYFILFFTPLSLTFEFTEFAALTLPTEPLLFGVMLVFFFKLIYEGGFDRRITRHPITIAILIHLIWMCFTSLTSTLPLVSIKFTIARLWFVVSFYFVATQIFKNLKDIRYWIWLFTIPLSLVIVYSVVQFFNYNIDKNALYWVMEPFFKDHTIYGAVIAMMLPVMFVFSFDDSYSRQYRFTSFIFFLIIFVGIILSYTRAAWLSIAAAYGAYLIFRLRIDWRIVMSGISIVLAILFYFKDDLLLKVESNKQSSSKDLAKHLQSVSNIKNDASNLERINRWSSALRMFVKKPFLGFGPGTYRFKYAPYQRSYELTYVSTNAGTLGNAHSEYLGPLAEQGIIGTLAFLSIVIASIVTGSRLYRTAKSREVRYLSIAILTGLFTYFFHGFLNNFLDQDKASAPFWSMIAILVALDVYHRNEVEKMDTNSELSAKE
jgi:putative inorganic carbon (HCO3(-)) transporter